MFLIKTIRFLPVLTTYSIHLNLHCNACKQCCLAFQISCTETHTHTHPHTHTHTHTHTRAGKKWQFNFSHPLALSRTSLRVLLLLFATVRWPQKRHLLALFCSPAGGAEYVHKTINIWMGVSTASPPTLPSTVRYTKRKHSHAGQTPVPATHDAYAYAITHGKLVYSDGEKKNTQTHTHTHTHTHAHGTKQSDQNETFPENGINFSPANTLAFPPPSPCCYFKERTARASTRVNSFVAFACWRWVRQHRHHFEGRAGSSPTAPFLMHLNVHIHLSPLHIHLSSGVHSMVRVRKETYWCHIQHN